MLKKFEIGRLYLTKRHVFLKDQQTNRNVMFFKKTPLLFLGYENDSSETIEIINFIFLSINNKYQYTFCPNLDLDIYTNERKPKIFKNFDECLENFLFIESIS